MSIVSPQYPFGQGLSDACGRTGRLCVGIDPHRHLLEQWGLSCDLKGLSTFTSICVEAFAGRVAVVKPQVAFYEAYGSQGFVVLEQALAACRAADTLVIADAKRGDIGSTNSGYADAWLTDGSPLACDALTVSPYLGVESLKPLAAQAAMTGRGLFVLARTSNPEAKELQEALLPHGGESSPSRACTGAQHVVDTVAQWNREMCSGARLGSFGVVVGATADTSLRLDSLGGPVLMPGVGAQGATKDDVKRLVPGDHTVAVPNISRALLEFGPSVKDLAAHLDQLNRLYFD